MELESKIISNLIGELCETTRILEHLHSKNITNKGKKQCKNNLILINKLLNLPPEEWEKERYDI